MSFGIVETLKCSTLNYQKGSRTKVKLHLNSHFYSIQKLTLAKFFSSFFLFLYLACSLFSVQGGSFFSALWFLVLVLCTLNGLAWFSIFFPLRSFSHLLYFYSESKRTTKWIVACDNNHKDVCSLQAGLYPLSAKFTRIFICKTNSTKSTHGKQDIADYTRCTMHKCT